MQLFKSYCKYIKVHPLTLVYVVVSFISGYWKFYLGAYTIVCIHEICHFIMAYSFRFEIEKISLLPFGAYLSLYDYGYRPIIYEMCVVLAGPCSHLFIYFILNLFKKYVYVQYLLKMNSLIFMFNLLPIYPMDGFRFILLCIENWIDLSKCQYIIFKISIFFLCLFISLCYRMNYYIIFFFLLYQNIEFYRNIPMYLRNYFINIPYVYKNKIKIHQDNCYLRDKENYYFFNGQLYYENEYKYALIKNVKRLEK